MITPSSFEADFPVAAIGGKFLFLYSLVQEIDTMRHYDLGLAVELEQLTTVRIQDPKNFLITKEPLRTYSSRTTIFCGRHLLFFV
jgi:hypothetical protein